MTQPITVETVLRKTAFPREEVDKLFDLSRPYWVRFDPELGYVPSDAEMQDGLDDSWSTYRHAPAGHRMLVNYADRPCRINTYGNSYTQCQQVSDGETWQECLAAHIGEPIRNFGCGGQSLKVACQKAKRMEATDCAAEYVILNIYDDDHLRSLDATRWIRSYWPKIGNPNFLTPLHGLPWVHVRYNLETGAFEDRPGACPDEAALRALTDPEVFYETYKDDTIVKLYTIMVGGEADVAELEALADVFGVDVDLRDPATRRADAERLHWEYGFRASEYILDDFREWAAAKGKHLLIMLSYQTAWLRHMCEGHPHRDQRVRDYLDLHGLRYVDVGAKHIEDYGNYRLSFDAYLDMLSVMPKVAAVFDHYTPRGNQFCAFAIKDEVVDWLNPKPPAYRHLDGGYTP
jgi:hypothetical protein